MARRLASLYGMWTGPAQARFAWEKARRQMLLDDLEVAAAPARWLVVGSVLALAGAVASGAGTTTGPATSPVSPEFSLPASEPSGISASNAMPWPFSRA